MTRTQPPTSPHYGAARTVVAAVTADLDQLRIGENLTRVHGQDGQTVWRRAIAPGDGWCRAQHAPVCAWPRGAALCVVLQWWPCRQTPPPQRGAHWAARLDAVTAGLRSLGYTVEHAGRRPDPATDRHAELLVYRTRPGRQPPRRPPGAWAHVPPPRSTFGWPENTPHSRLQTRINLSALPHVADVTVRDLATCLWPPSARYAACVTVTPAPGSPTHEALGSAAAAVRSHGYRTRQAEPAVTGTPPPTAFLAYHDGPDFRSVTAAHPFPH
ncbi:hypothetical protein AB0D49_33180 [Streptomyces sp. NPDC048290]|uniref:hypothetical protein n=1 Tax=Streptomyces sp. NPDC048290 TaxID=3155811 RepID=UPI003427EF3A